MPNIKFKIPMLDLKEQYYSLKEEIEKSLHEISESGLFILGPNVEAFEKDIASYHGVRYAAGVASGTDALNLALRAIGLKKGDEVITTPFTFIAAAEAITYDGGVPVFVDIEKDTFNIDPVKIEEKITPRTKVILPVHLFGQPADMDAITDIAKRHNLIVIEDCAQSFGAGYKGKATGSMGKAGCFSFYPSKNLGAYGDGGIIVTDDEKIYDFVKLLRNHGSAGGYRHKYIGYNSRLDEFQAAILRIKLKHIDSYNQKRRGIAELYSSLLGGAVKCPSGIPGTTHVYHQYTIRSPKREHIKKTLEDNSVASVVYYPVPLHLQEAFAHLGYREGDLPQSEAAAKEVLSLPMYPELEHEKVRFISEVISKCL
ncbi:MAG: DegT/DnrJ/EryC1/StrS family aminotransferase [Nitrospirae bacterium]|nr:DegT/DnrJ/EryC1/StrS family aminotransferase [Nitrospirota bacterium]